MRNWSVWGQVLNLAITWVSCHINMTHANAKKVGPRPSLLKAGNLNATKMCMVHMPPFTDVFSNFEKSKCEVVFPWNRNHVFGMPCFWSDCEDQVCPTTHQILIILKLKVVINTYLVPVQSCLNTIGSLLQY